MVCIPLLSQMFIDDTGDFGGSRDNENRQVEFRSLAAVHPTPELNLRVSSVRGALIFYPDATFSTQFLTYVFRFFC